MGAWGPGSFENDDAADWVETLTEAEDASVLTEAFTMVIDAKDDDIEAPVGAGAIAAAEVVAALLGKSAKDLPPEVAEWVQEQEIKPDAELHSLALTAVQLVLDSDTSELKELWEEDEEEGAPWRAAVNDLIKRLGGPR